MHEGHRMVDVQDHVEPVPQPVLFKGYFRGRGTDRWRQAEKERCAGGNA
jgi:hypothetical protein